MPIPNPRSGQHDCVLIELPTDVERARPVLAAAISLFGPGTDVVLWVTDGEPTRELAERLALICRQLAGGTPGVSIEVAGAAEAGRRTARVSVRAEGDPMGDARAIVLLAAVAFQDWEVVAAPGPGPSSAADVLAARDAAIAGRDLRAPRGVAPVVAVIAQVQATWGAVETVCQALRADPRVQLEVVAVDSDHDVRATSTADHLRSLGYQPRSLDWLRAQVEDPGSALATVLFYDPWDDLRPAPARAVPIAESGLRIAYVPYGNNVGAGEHVEQTAFDLPMHRLAWRLFARSERQRQMYAEHCAVGAEHVRVVGMPKFDRVVRLTTDPIRPLPVPATRMTVLWNPHFTFGPQGWSTFDRYLVPLLDYAASHPQMCLVVRPHFRLLHDLPLIGGAGAQLLELLRSTASRARNVVLDTSADYLPAFAAADAMISDLSSLVSEFALTRKPLCYLHKEDGPGVNEDAEYFFEVAVATSWPGIEGFLDRLLRESGRVRAGTDADRQSRDLLVARHFPLEDGQAGARIARELVDQLLAERQGLPSIGGRDDRLAHV
jgi:hypothetical protein